MEAPAPRGAATKGTAMWARRVAVAVAGLAMLGGALTAAPAAATAAQDYGFAWSGAVAPRTLTVPGSAGGYLSYVVGSFPLRLPSGGSWSVESSLTATGVARSTAPGSRYGRVSFGHTLECGADVRNSAGRVASPTGVSVSGRNVLYDLRSITSARMLWPAVRGADRCDLVVTIGWDDRAVAGKRITLNGGYVRLVGRGLDDAASRVRYGLPQTASLGLSTVRFLSPTSRTITSPNFEISTYVAPPRIAVAGNAAVTEPITRIDTTADAYITTCYSLSSSTSIYHLPACPYSNGTLTTAATYQQWIVVQQRRRDGSLCHQWTSATLTQSTPSYVHHQEARSRTQVTIDNSCGSRSFRVKLYLRWIGGNTFFVETTPLSRITIRPTTT